MPIEVETKDCAQLSDAELAEMADLTADGPFRFEVGLLSKEVQAWVLVTTARENGKLKGYSFCTLERIGGTPSVLVGLATVKRTAKRDSVLKAMVLDQLFSRAVIARWIAAGTPAGLPDVALGSAASRPVRVW